MSLPDRALSNFDIESAVKDLRLKNFRGVFMRDTLPKKPWKNECLVLNLGSSKGQGNHWLCIVKRSNAKVYFDSYGLPPPREVVTYSGKGTYYNTTPAQHGGYLCGHYCIAILTATNNSTEESLLRDTQAMMNKIYILAASLK